MPTGVLRSPQCANSLSRALFCHCPWPRVSPGAWCGGRPLVRPDAMRPERSRSQLSRRSDAHLAHYTGAAGVQRCVHAVAGRPAQHQRGDLRHHDQRCNQGADRQRAFPIIDELATATTI